MPAAKNTPVDLSHLNLDNSVEHVSLPDGTEYARNDAGEWVEATGKVVSEPVNGEAPVAEDE